jgi:hypothetical protein
LASETKTSDGIKHTTASLDICRMASWVRTPRLPTYTIDVRHAIPRPPCRIIEVGLGWAVI